MKVLIVHPGTQYAHYLVKQLDKHGLLYKFYTGFAIAEKSFTGRLYKILPAFIREKIANRFIESLGSEKLVTNTFIELRAVYALKKQHSETVFYKRNKIIQERIPDELILNSDMVIGFDTSSWILAEKCKRLGKRFILDVSIGHPKAKELVYSALQIKYPHWQEQVQSKSLELIALEEQEIELADTVVVPSAFVKKTYTDNGVPAGKIVVNPFGTQMEDFANSNLKKLPQGKIKFLFFGALTARKGLPMLLEAWGLMDTCNAELTIAGYGEIPDLVYLPDNVTNRGVVLKEERQELYETHHVFVFPSNFEGFAQVQIEAAASGLPIIGTFNSGVTELVEDGIDGFVVPTNDVYALIKSLQYFIDNPAQINTMGNRIKEKSIHFTWDAYGERWVKITHRIV